MLKKITKMKLSLLLRPMNSSPEYLEDQPGREQKPDTGIFTVSPL